MASVFRISATNCMNFPVSFFKDVWKCYYILINLFLHKAKTFSVILLYLIRYTYVLGSTYHRCSQVLPKRKYCCITITFIFLTFLVFHAYMLISKSYLKQNLDRAIVSWVFLWIFCVDAGKIKFSV